MGSGDVAALCVLCGDASSWSRAGEGSRGQGGIRSRRGARILSGARELSCQPANVISDGFLDYSYILYFIWNLKTPLGS
jgi:hypothetical protein